MITLASKRYTILPWGTTLDSRYPEGNGGATTFDFYVSTTGSDSNDGSYGSPFLTLVHAASQLTVDGQTLGILAGTYDVSTPTTGRSCAVYPRANNCTISAVPGNSVTIRGGRSGANFGVSPTGGTIGCVSGKSGLTISGLTIQGMVMFDGNTAGTQASRIENCDVSVGGDGWVGTDQGACIWIDDAYNVEVVNCVIHDNTAAAGSGTPANDGLFMVYDIDGLLIENCTIRDSVGTGITMKDDAQNVVIRKNWIKDNDYSGIWTGNNAANAYADSGDIYQNVIANNNTANDAEHGGITLVVETSLLNIYNNTFHRNYRGELTEWSSGADVPFTFFNNLCYGSRSKYLAWPYSNSAFTATYLDYNGYNGGASGWTYRTNDYANLAAWQTGVNALLTGADANAVNTDPGFLNATGTWTATSDYKRTAYTANGRGGAWPTVMGAFITGSETIGATA